MFICNICEESFDGDRTTCKSCFDEIASIVSNNFSKFDNPEFSFSPTKREFKLRTSIESCAAKKPYKTPEEAVRARKRLGKLKPEVKSQRIYKCDSCEFWHLTSAKKSQ
jgi:hypothetical protein